MRPMLTAVAAMMLSFPVVGLSSPAAAQRPGTLPGTLIASEPMPGAPAGATAWRIRYASTDDRGRREEVSGFVVVPDGPAPRGGRPVLAWAHGTWGVVDKCVPTPASKLFALTPGLTDALARGYAVVATDYSGFGTSRTHPYLVGASAGNAVLDSVRAARSLRGADVGARFAVWGESQGGHAAIFTGERARAYAPDLTLVGVAAAAPPTDLAQNLVAGSDPSIRAFLTGFTAYSWSQHYGVPLKGIGRAATPRLIERLSQNCITIGKTPKLGQILGIIALRRDLKGVDLGRIAPWSGYARTNSAGRAGPPPVPMLIAQNTADAIVAPAVTRAYARRMCARGARLRWIDIVSKGGHPTSAADSATATLNWIADRFAGTPAPSDCRRI